jgi:hypothetical protein
MEEAVPIKRERQNIAYGASFWRWFVILQVVTSRLIYYNANETPPRTF